MGRGGSCDLRVNERHRKNYTTIQYRVQNTETAYRVHYTEYRAQNTEYRIQSTEYRVTSPVLTIEPDCCPLLTKPASLPTQSPAAEMNKQDNISFKFGYPKDPQKLTPPWQL